MGLTKPFEASSCRIVVLDSVTLLGYVSGILHNCICVIHDTTLFGARRRARDLW